MPKILKEYSFNIPKGLTRKVQYHGARGGRCPRPCAECEARQLCGGCDSLCPDRECSGTHCQQCACLCSRGGKRLQKAIEYIGGLNIDKTAQDDKPFDVTVKYIPAITRPLKVATFYPIVSIPFYALWDFETMQPLTTQIRKAFCLSDTTQIIVNFYFKDDKIMYLFDRMIDGTFLNMLRQFPEVTYWHTPCFSVFTQASGMDTLLNFKRQFWIGDIMRAAGLNVIQEVLYSLKPKIQAGMKDALEIISVKRIKKISQNCQLIYNFTQSLFEERPFVRGLPQDVHWLMTGLSSQHAEAYRTLRWRNTFFANYTAEFKHRKDWEDYINSVNAQMLS